MALIVTGASLLTAAGVWWKKLTPVWQRLKAMHDLIERELTPNGGSSMKDQVSDLGGKVDTVHHQVAQVRAHQSAMADVVDVINTNNRAEHQRLWDALAALGFDRRRKEGS